MWVYLTNDLSEVCSVWCSVCEVVVKYDGVKKHLNVQHSTTFLSIEYHVSEGLLDFNYQSFCSVFTAVWLCLSLNLSLRVI